MFLHQLTKDNKLLTIKFHPYAERHFLKRFKKEYKGKQWEVTQDSIEQDLSRIKMDKSDLQKSQQVDELWYNNGCWIFKYDFRVAKTNESTKSSGNRCIVFLNSKDNLIQILVIFGKNDLPKNAGEQAYIKKTLTEEFSDIMEKTLSL